MRNQFNGCLTAILVCFMAASAHAQEPVDRSSSFLGRWKGLVPLAGSPIDLQLNISRNEEGLQIAVTALRLQAINAPATDILTRDGRLAFELAVASLRMDVGLTPDEEGLKGRFAFLEGPPAAVALPPTEFMMRKVPPIDGTLDVTRYNGTLAIPGGGNVGISLVLADVDGKPVAEVDILQQGITGLIVDVERAKDNPNQYRFVLPVPVPATMDMELADGVFEGTFSQGPFDLPLVMAPGEAPVVAEPQRPQEPKPPFPYEMRELQVPTLQGHELAGTLVMPLKAAAEGAPVVVMVTGSGPQDRDEALMGHRPFYVLADRLARQGIASFRYDDRGTKESGGVFEGAITADFAHDAAAAVALVRTQPGIDARRIGVLGHSEGSTVAAMVGAGEAPDYADADRPDFLVLLAGPGVPGHEVLREQMRRLLVSEGIDEENVSRISVAQEALLDAVIGDADRDTLLARARALQEAQLAVNGLAQTLTEADKEALSEKAIVGLETPWMRSFLLQDPRESLRKLTMPVLAVNGTLDSQVWHEQNLPEIEKAVREGGGTIEIMRIEGLNHLLQPARTGAVSEYQTIEITMDEDTMGRIASWINRTMVPAGR
ncbi:MAG: alpha/beta hydrolase [Phycisphaerales bacterium]|nr:alpha/beta hydrolase [Phycisphaerales bacterium]